MKIISLINAKGGVSKTTATLNISTILAKQGKSILLIDMDHQGNLTNYFIQSKLPTNDITDVLLHGCNINETMLDTNYSNIKLLPNFGKLEQEYINISSFSEREQTLKNNLALINATFDYVFIDCPPALDEFVKNSLIASDFILIPIKADASGYHGLSRIFDKTSTLIDVYNRNLKILGVFASDKENTNVHKETMQLLRQNMPSIIFNTEIRHSKDVPESSFMRLPLIEYAPYSKPTFDYKRLVIEIENRISSL